jgi:hypothetical protein
VTVHNSREDEMKTIVKIACIASAASLMAGCGAMKQAAQERQSLRYEYERTIPTCGSEKDCELKWSAARTFVLSNSDRKLQHITNDYLETYNPAPSSPGLAWRVNKEATGSSSYRIVATAWCANMFGCVPDNLTTMLRFNEAVNAARVSP